MYDQTDPRAKLAASAAKPAPKAFVGADFGLFYENAPQLTDQKSRTWITRGQNFLVAYSEIEPGAVLERTDQVDEYVFILPDRDSSATVTANGASHEVPGFSLVIVPPGDSRIEVTSGTRAVRVFSTQSEDLDALCSNADSYAEPHPNIPPFQPWPEPRDGYKVRVYSLDVPKEPGRFGRIFRCTTLMINYLDEQDGPRDTTKLSPHHHDDFEQGSLALAGTYMHHLRWPWTTDLSAWREDQHAFCQTPSLTVIPPPAIHTSRGTDAGLNQLVDIFSPPRVDFSMQNGWVLNADEYPMPGEAAMN